jgi:hypothetical protein
MEIYEAMRTTFAATTGIGKLVRQLIKPKRNPREGCIWADTFAAARFGG